MEKIKWGILGTANIAEKALIPSIIKAENAELYAIAGRKSEKVDIFKKLFNPVKSYHSYDEILNDKDIDIIYNPLPDGLHKEWTIKALNKGKNVLCEKPLGLNFEEDKEMFEVAEKNEKILMEAFAYKYNPIIKGMKKIIDEGKIGKVKSINSSFSFNLKKRRPNDIRFVKNLGGGAIYDLGCYTTHVSRLLLDKEPVNASGIMETMGENGVDLTSTVLLEFPDNIVSTFQLSFDRESKVFLEICGTDGAIFTEYPFNSSGKIFFELKKIDKKYITEKTYFNVVDNYLFEVQELSKAVLNESAELVTKEDSLNNAKALDLIFNSLRKKQI
jgi:predicted dehydrogenase